MTSIGATNPLKKVSFTSTDPNKIVNLHANITAQEIFLGGAKFRLANDITLTSTAAAATHVNSYVFDLGLSTLTFTGNIVHDDANN